MPLPRSRLNVLQSIHPLPSSRPQIRCLRTKPGRASQQPPAPLSTDPPKQSAFTPFSISKAIRDARRKVNEKPAGEKIPIVPKLDEDENPIQWRLPEPDSKKIKVERELNTEELEEKEKLKEREKRIQEYEELERKLEGKTELDVIRDKTTSRIYGDEYVQEKADNTVYPRDHVGAKFFKKKDKVKWKADVYDTI